MAEIKKFLPLFCMLCGVVNVLVIKWADKTESEDSTGNVRLFQHPFLQTSIMFFGQMLCFFIYKIIYFFLQRRNDGSEDRNLLTGGGREFSPVIFILPSLCDLIASAMLFSGLYLTYSSSWQMLRGACLIFVGLFSVNYLNQILKGHHWLGMLTVISGLSLVIFSDITYIPFSDSKAILTGDLLIICSQIFQGFQYVYEEKFIKTLDIPPLQAVGWQGIFGFIQTLLLFIPLNFIKVDPPFDNNSNGVIEYLPDAFSQFINNSNLVLAHLVFMTSVALYNYSAVAVMKDTSSTGRLLIDSFRVILIWLIALFLQWEYFNVLAFFGFIILLSGVFIYKNVVFVQLYRWFLGRLSRRRYDDIDGGEQVISTPADSAEA